MLKPQGRRGEVAAEILTDFPERFDERRRLFALDASGARRELQLESWWRHKGQVVLKFGGIDSISQAQALTGVQVQVPRAERAPLPPGAAYVGDLMGCTVVDLAGGGELGEIEDVQFGAGDAPLLVVRRGAKEYLVPYAAEFLRRVDVEARRVEMSLPQGLLDIDAPLTEEEKREQGG